jgi:hypothetical protein
MADLPALLAGPIVRRVMPGSCSIWLATSEPTTATVSVYAGTRVASQAGGAVMTASAPLIKLGAKLYAGVITVGTKDDNAVLAPGSIYSYDVELQGPSGTKNLEQLELLRDHDGADGKPKQFALGYVEHRLPSFVTPAGAIDQLRMAHASCRKPSGQGPDAMSWLDDLIAESFTDTTQRPQQLFLTGDQIYADDLPACLLSMLIPLSRELLGYDEKLTVDGDSGGQRWTELHDLTLINFPPLRRSALVRNAANFTSTDCDNHLLGFGEFAAMYLAAWSPRVWSDLASDEALLVQLDPSIPAKLKALLTDWETIHEGSEKWKQHAKPELERQRAGLEQYRATVGKVARALANVSTYMIWDDHELTDDWNLNKRWRNRVLSTSLGKDILRNGGIAYGLFQAWGNDPASFMVKDSVNSLVLTLAKALYADPPQLAGALDDRPEDSPYFRAEALIGNRGGADDQALWHFSVPGPRHLVVVLDSRTRRSFQGEGIAPASLLGDSLDLQLPAGPFKDGRELLVVVSPAPVLVPHIMDRLAAPVFAQIADFKYGVETQQQRATHPERHGDSVTGVESADDEGWSANELAREALLERLATYRQVILLSGDVHYGYSMTLDYWTGGEQPASRIVQLTSSAARNPFDPMVESVLRHQAGLQRYEQISAEQLRWTGKAELDIPPNVKLKPGRLSRIKRSPSLVSARGWPAGVTFSAGKLPSSRWRLKLVRDNRPEEQLPRGDKLPALPEELPSSRPDGPTLMRIYGEIANNHQKLALEGKFRLLRQLVFGNNLGLLSFSGSGDALLLKHSLLSQQNAEDGGEPTSKKGVLNTVHEVPLRLSSEPAPKLETGS